VNIGMVCYASVGGSGVVATELAHALARRGHRVHVISSEPPFRWRSGVPGLFFEQVEVPTYPLFREPQYLLALSTSIARVVETHQLELVHAHYAVPHAAAAYLARQILSSSAAAPRTMTTLHGTDITVVGSDPSYARVVAFSIEQSHGVTAVSRSLRADTISGLGIRHAIDVIPNFLDCEAYQRRFDPALRERLAPTGRYDAIVLHVSNFRPVKRVEAAIEVFRRIRQHVRARFVLAGDGPVRAGVERVAADHRMGDDVLFLGEQQELVPLLSVSDLFLLPSAQESFGLAALEAMACGVPVVASKVGGLPEIVDDGVTGFLCPLDDLDGMADRAVSALTTPGLHERMARAAAAAARSRYCTEMIVPLYEAAYRRVVDAVTA
jgi:N-acetyl-alpha-D-glucosaminyl L-malate synthase BshA